MLHKTTTSFDHLLSPLFAGNTYTYPLPSFHRLRYSYAPLHFFALCGKTSLFRPLLPTAAIGVRLPRAQ
jgi:hypothetical protein